MTAATLLVTARHRVINCRWVPPLPVASAGCPYTRTDTMVVNICRIRRCQRKRRRQAPTDRPAAARGGLQAEFKGFAGPAGRRESLESRSGGGHFVDDTEDGVGQVGPPAAQREPGVSEMPPLERSGDVFECGDELEAGRRRDDGGL
jgi:hypothetical protein